jgi:hypothetical protein
MLSYLKMIIARERFDVLSAMNVKITVFWSLTPCSLVGGCQYYGLACCLTSQSMEAAGYSWSLPSLSTNNSVKSIRRYERTVSKFCKVMQAHYSPPYRAEVKDEWSYTSSPPPLHGIDREDFTFNPGPLLSIVANPRHEKESTLENCNLPKPGIRRCYNVHVILVYIVSRILLPPC